MAPSSAGVFTRNTASPATISRWFRGDAVPTDEDLQRLSTLLEVPVQNFFALRFLEDVLKKKQPTVVSIGAWHYLASAGSTLVLAGVSMVSRVIHLRDLDLSSKTIIISTLSDSALRQYEIDLDGQESSCLRSCWLATADTLLALARKFRSSRFQLWVRDHKRIEDAYPVGQLVANDWVAIEASSPESEAFSVHVRGDEHWSTFIEPTAQRLKAGTPINGERLIYSSEWSGSDARIREFDQYCRNIAETIKQIHREPPATRSSSSKPRRI